MTKNLIVATTQYVFARNKRTKLAKSDTYAKLKTIKKKCFKVCMLILYDISAFSKMDNLYQHVEGLLATMATFYLEVFFAGFSA